MSNRTKAIVLGAVSVFVIVYVWWTCTAIRKLQFQVSSLTFEIEVGKRVSDELASQRGRVIDLMERRQNHLENIIFSNDNLNLTLETIREYNASTRSESPDATALGGEEDEHAPEMVRIE